MRRKTFRPSTLWRTTLFITLSLLLAGCSSMPSEAERHSEFDALGDPDARLTYSTAFPIANPEEAVVRGDAAVAKGDLNRALFEYIRALEKGGADGATLYKIGRMHLALKDPRRAELAFRLSLKALPDHVGALLEMGKLLIHKRAYPSAAELLGRALELAPDSPQVFNALGVLADMQKRHHEAENHYIKALFLGGDKPIYLNNLGYSYYLMGCQDRAKQMFLNTLKLDPNYKRAWRNLGLIYAKSARFRQALEAFGKVEKEYEAYNDVGYVAMLSGRFDEAQRFFAEAVRLSPVYYELAMNNAKRLELLRSNAH